MLARNLRLLALLAALLGGGALLVGGELRLPGDHSGYAPTQPIAFSHRLHAGEMQIDCRYCHAGAEQSRHAGIPEASVCMNCHATVTARRDVVVAEQSAATRDGREPRTIVAPELRKLYRALGLNDERQRDPALALQPIEWVRIHRLPDFVYFDHRPHVQGGVACESCHGPVQAMDRVRQQHHLSMGWCVECHRSRAPTVLPSATPPTLAPVLPAGHPATVSIDCAACHF